MGVKARIKAWLYTFTSINNIVNWSKRKTLPGFEGLPVYNVIKLFFQEEKANSLSTRAYAVAFRFFLAIFPGMIFVFSLIPYIPIKDFQLKALVLMQDIMPKNAYELMESTFYDLISNPRGGLLSFGFLIALYFGTNGIHALINSFNASFHTIEKRGFLKQRAISILMVFIMTFLMMMAIIIIIAGAVILNYLGKFGLFKDSWEVAALQITEWFVILALFFIGISFLYYLGPSKKVRFTFINPGSTLATILCILTSWGFSFYVNNFGNYNKLYGSIGTVMVIMMWVYLNSYNILLGFELNATIYLAKRKVLQPPDTKTI